MSKGTEKIKRASQQTGTSLGIKRDVLSRHWRAAALYVQPIFSESTEVSGERADNQSDRVVTGIVSIRSAHL